MDAESLAQIEQIVSGAEERLRKEVTTLGTSLRQEFGEKFEEARRHRGVLFEEMGRKLGLLLESQRGLDEDMDRLEATVDQEFHEAQALIRSMIDQSNPQSKTQPPHQSYLA